MTYLSTFSGRTVFGVIVFFSAAMAILFSFSSSASMKKSNNLHSLGDSLNVKRQKSKDLLQEVVAAYAVNPEKTLEEAKNPTGTYSNIDQSGDSFVAYINPHGIHSNPSWKNPDKSVLSLLMGPYHEDVYGRESTPVAYGQMLLDALTVMKAGEEKTLVFAANKRPSTGRPAQAVLLLHKNEDGSIFYSPYYSLNLLHMDPHKSAEELG